MSKLNIFLLVDNPPPDWGPYRIISAFISKVYANKALEKYKKKDGYLSQYMEVIDMEIEDIK